MLAAFAVLVTAAYWVGNPQALVTAKWAAVSLAPVMLLWMPRVRWSIIHTGAVILIGWAAITMSWSPVTADAADALWKMALGFVLFCVGYETGTLRPFYIAAAIGLLPSSVIAIGQAAGIQFDGGTLIPSGLFGSPNMLGEAAALIAVALFVQGVWWPQIIVAPSLLLPMARGAYLAVLAVLLLRGRVLTAAAILMLALLALPQYRALSDLSSMRERIAIWAETASHVSVVGKGLGSFETVMEKQTALPNRIVTHAHNELLERAVELGIIGCVLAVALAGLVVAKGQPCERAVIAALGIESLFGFPLSMPVTAAIGAVVAGHAARGWVDVRFGELVRGEAFRLRPGEYGLP